jgi:carbonic anhydrase/acetyltransferase-like protein (isoleucine patch superfamily)
MKKCYVVFKDCVIGDGCYVSLAGVSKEHGIPYSSLAKGKRAFVIDGSSYVVKEMVLYGFKDRGGSLGK